MKKSVILIAMFLLLVSVAHAQYSYSNRFPSVVDINLIKQEADPAAPGEVVELKFRVENKGERVATNVQVELLPEYPFSLRPGDAAVQNIGSVESQQRGEDGVVVIYKVIVDRNAPDGTHEIGLRYKDAEHSSWVEFDNFTVRVRSGSQILLINRVVSVPTMIAPGDKSKLAIELRNYATSPFKDIVVKLDLSSVSLTPMGSSNEKVISQIGPQESRTAEFELMALPDAVAGVVKVPVTLSYTDITGRNYSKSSTISAVIGDTPDITVGLERTDIYTEGSVGSAVVRVVNKGTTDVKFLNVQLLPVEGVEIIGSSESYIGNLDSDDFSTAEFQLYVKDADGQVNLPVIVEYKDANNNNYKQELALPLKLYSSSQAKKISGNGNNTFIWVMVLVVIGAGIWYYRRRKKKQKL
jgi:LPXTG-motif cell wall-anchored protein